VLTVDLCVNLADIFVFSMVAE